MNGKYYYNYEELNRDNVESEKIKFSHKSQVEVSTVYEFFKKLSDKDIEMYHQRMKQALANVPKVQEQRMSQITVYQDELPTQVVEERRVMEDYIDKFRESNSILKKKIH